MNDFDWMKEAYALALKAKNCGEVPVGSVLVSEENQQIGVGFNHMITTHDPTAHAEILAIRNACQFTQNYRLDNATLYITLEPCPMCAGAIIQARIKRIVFATRDFKSGAAGSVCNLFQQHAIQIDEGVLQKECSNLLVDFFKQTRHTHKK